MIKYLAIIVISLIVFTNYSVSSSGRSNLNNEGEKDEISFYFEMTEYETKELLRKVSLLKDGFKYEKIIEILEKIEGHFPYLLDINLKMEYCLPYAKNSKSMCCQLSTPCDAAGE